MKSYVNIGMPRGMIKSIDSLIEENPGLGIRNRSELVISLVRNYLIDAAKTGLLPPGKLKQVDLK